MIKEVTFLNKCADGQPFITCSREKATHVKMDKSTEDQILTLTTKYWIITDTLNRWKKEKIDGEIEKETIMLNQRLDENESIKQDISDIQSTIADNLKKIDEMNRRNAPLIRMIREKMNISRGLNAKDMGYLIVRGEDSIVYTHNDDNDDVSTTPVDVWRVTIESNLPAEIDRISAEEILYPEIMKILLINNTSFNVNNIYDIKYRVENGLWQIQISSKYQPNLPFKYRSIGAAKKNSRGSKKC